MTFQFPVELVREGRAEFFVPELGEKTGRAEYAPSDYPVFYNPRMKLNRDLAVLALQAFQRNKDSIMNGCEPFGGCGVRSIRFALEVDGIGGLTVSDLDHQAAELIRFNVERNGLSDRVAVEEEDANVLLGCRSAPGLRFDFIDVDPFGSPAGFLDSAVRALSDGGLLALTSTDTASLCGAHPSACIRKYWGRPLRVEYCHELAVRILIGSLALTASRHKRGVNIRLSHSTDHYVRVYAELEHGARPAGSSIGKMGYVLHCFNCFHREAVIGLARGFELECEECGKRLAVSGPLWLGEISDKRFCNRVIEEAERREAGGRTMKLLDRIMEEADGPPTYYVMNRICDRLGLVIPPVRTVVQRLRDLGYHATQTHFAADGVRTDASAMALSAALRELQPG